MDYVIERTHVIDHVRFLEAGPLARDLWHWGMLYAGCHETDGDLPTTAILASPWGAGGKSNARTADRLVEVGLWERTGNGFRILRWAEQGNKTKAQLEERRREERSKKQRQRGAAPSSSSFVAALPVPPCPPSCPPGTPLGTPQGTPSGSPEVVLNSPSYSLSGSGSPEVRDPDPGQVSARAPDPPGPVTVPDWFIGVLATLEATGAEPIEAGMAWLRYRGHRETKHIAMSVTDAQYWLTTVIVGEQRKAREDRRRHQDLRAGPPSPPHETPAQAKAFRSELTRRLLEDAPARAKRIADEVRRAADG